MHRQSRQPVSRDSLDRELKVRCMVLPDVFIDHDKPEKMYAEAGLDAAGTVATACSALGLKDRILAVEAIARA